MKPKTRAILMSAFVCPGLGQVIVGKRRGYLFIAGSVIVLVLLFLSIFRIILQEMPPEMLMNMSPLEYSSAFVKVRQRTYYENIPIMVAFLAIWLGSIIDLAVRKTPENKPDTPD